MMINRYSCTKDNRILGKKDTKESLLQIRTIRRSNYEY